MRPVVQPTAFEARVRAQIRIMKVLMVVLVVVGISLTSYEVIGAATSDGSGIEALAASGDEPPVLPEPTVVTTTTMAVTTTTVVAVTPTTLGSDPVASPPQHGNRYVVRTTEIEPEAKQLAADIAHTLTTYDEDEDRLQRIYSIAGTSEVETLAAAMGPLDYPGSWSRGEVLYPQLGGLSNGRASVMVVTRQTVGSGSETHFSVVRTLDIRLTDSDTGWAFEALESAGGTFDDIDDLTLAHEVAADPRIEMPDSARLDIRAGLVSPRLLQLMADLADRTPYAIAVLATGHPIHVFETDRTSDHTFGRAIDIIRVGDRLLIDDRSSRSASQELVEWLFEHPDVSQVGSPWDLDGPDANRSFTDLVHQDHIHVAVIED